MFWNGELLNRKRNIAKMLVTGNQVLSQPFITFAQLQEWWWWPLGSAVQARGGLCVSVHLTPSLDVKR